MKHSTARVTSILAMILLLFIMAVPSHAQQSNVSPLASQTWVRLGGPLGGLGYDIRMNPDDPNIMYVTDAWSGVYKSTDGGHTWASSYKGISERTGPSGDAIPVFSLTIDPNDPNIIWAGTQNFGTLYRSADGGQTWEKRTNGIIEGVGLSLRGIAIEPGNSEVIYTAGEISSGRWAGQVMQGREFDMVKGVVYKSTDSGLTWTAIWRGDNLARYVLINPTNVQTLYVSTGIFDREAANSDPATNTPGGVGVLKSIDGGKTWKQINDGLNNLYIGSLFMNPKNPQILLAGAGNNAYQPGGGIYLTTDGGAHWQYKGGQEVISVEFALGDPQIAYAGESSGSGNFYRSEDGGLTWNISSPQGWGPRGTYVGFPIDLQVDPRNPDRIFVNAYGGGNFLSEDGGKTWISSSTGYTGADLTDIAIHPANPAVVYANGRSGPFVSLDGGVTWAGINPMNPLIAEGARVSVDPSTPSHVLMSSAHWGWTLESLDSGMSWQLVTNYFDRLASLPFPNTNQKFQGFQAIAFAPSAPEKVYGGMGVCTCVRESDNILCNTPPLYSLLLSEDGGNNWTPLEGTPLDKFSVSSIVVNPTDPATAWAAAVGGGAFVTHDGGKSWQAASQGLSSLWVMKLAIDPNNPAVLYAGTSDRGVFKTEDGGASWMQSSGGMDPNEPIGSVAVDPVRSSVVYAGSWSSGVYLSEDGGKSWRLIDDGLRTRSVRALAISSDGETLYAATRGEGAFRLSTHEQAYFDSLVPTPTPPITPLPSVIPTPVPPTASPILPGATPSLSYTPTLSRENGTQAGRSVWLYIGVPAGLIVIILLILLLRKKNQ